MTTTTETHPQSLVLVSAVTYIVRPDDTTSPSIAHFGTLAEVRAWGRERGYVLRRIAPGGVGRCHRLVRKGR
jgi:hypothetical protein